MGTILFSICSPIKLNFISFCKIIWSNKVCSFFQKKGLATIKAYFWSPNDSVQYTVNLYTVSAGVWGNTVGPNIRKDNSCESVTGFGRLPNWLMRNNHATSQYLVKNHATSPYLIKNHATSLYFIKRVLNQLFFIIAPPFYMADLFYVFIYNLL